MTVPKIVPCKCGCGGFASRNRFYVSGHNVKAMGNIRPAGMSAERALQIAVAVYDSGNYLSWRPARLRRAEATS